VPNPHLFPIGLPNVQMEDISQFWKTVFRTGERKTSFLSAEADMLVCYYAKRILVINFVLKEETGSRTKSTFTVGSVYSHGREEDVVGKRLNLHFLYPASLPQLLSLHLRLTCQGHFQVLVAVMLQT
jgi:hypothetical protein